MNEGRKRISSTPPDDRYMRQVKVGSKGQIIIPKEVRDLFGISPGDNLILLADINQGMALQRFDAYQGYSIKFLILRRMTNERNRN